MTKEEKQLLLTDLCTRLPYGIKFTLSGNNIYTMKGIDLIVTDEGDWEYAITSKGIAPIEIMYVKPYLRPMSSMTEEEEIYYNTVYTTLKFYEKEDWLNAHHFDFRSLIPLGLALEAPKDMYKQ
jgi:hypothetical protein